MANGVLGARSLSAGIPQNIYVNNSSDVAVVAINVCNFNHISTRISIAISTLGHAGVTNSEYIEFNAELLGKGVLTRTGVAISSGQYVVVKSTESNVSSQVWGVEVGTTTGTAVITANTSGDGPAFLGATNFDVIAGDAS